VLKEELLIWRTKNQARDQGTVQLKDSICFKSVQIGSMKSSRYAFIGACGDCHVMCKL
jgi:hypothetical protein